MRTLVYCTSYSSTLSEWTKRYRPWLDAIKDSGIADQILIADDASPVLPGWDDTRISSGDSLSDALPPLSSDWAILHRFSHRRGRISSTDCRGWYRSYGFGAAYALKHGFERVVHVESDAYLISNEIKDYVRNFTEGWAALWSERYKFPELAIQVAAGTGLRSFYDFTQSPYDHLIGRDHESLVPFTHVERSFTGDRYGEDTGPVPKDIDYVCQVQWDRQPSYYWWRLHYSPELPDGSYLGTATHYDFSHRGNTDQIVGYGWSHPEADFRWMVDFESSLNVPLDEHNGSYIVKISSSPLTCHDVVPSQALTVVVNEATIARFELSHETEVAFTIGRENLRPNQINIMTFHHPNGIAPSAFSDNLSDKRVLSLAVRSIAFVPIIEVDVTA